MEIPNARILEDGVVRFGAAQALPYRWYSGGMGIFPGLEFTGRLTEITNIPALGPEYGAYKDKAFDLKYQILPESKILPAIAIGINDFWGTRLFPSEYIVISRQYFPIDLTLGIGSKRLKGSFTLPVDLPNFNPFDFGEPEEFGFFGGFEIALHDRLHFMAEYNPVEYEKDFLNAVPEGAKYPINLGVRAKLLPGIDFGLSYQRGDTFGMMLHIQAELGRQILPPRPDPPPLIDVDRRPFRERDQREMIEEIHDAIHEAGFSDVSVYTDGTTLIAQFENTKYFSNQKAVGRVLRIMLFHSPLDTKNLIAIVRRRDMPILKVSVRPDHLEKHLLGKIPEDIFYNKLINIQITNRAIEDRGKDFIQTQEEKKSRFNFRIKPDLEIYWNDPSGFLKYRAGIKPSVTASLWKGALAYARYDIPFYSNIYSPTAAALPPEVVRSDISKYLTKYYSFDKLMINQVFRISEKTFGRLNLGYFENMYAGIGGETLYFPGEGQMAFGIESDLVRKRVSETQFELMDFNRYSVLGNFYYYFPGLDMTLNAQYGRFLAGDTGWMLDINRRYATGIVLGIFWSFTDTDDVPLSFNKDYNHKGVYLRLPVRMFLTRDSRQMFNYGISPWTRDVGVTVSHWQELFDIGKDLMPAQFKANMNKVKE